MRKYANYYRYTFVHLSKYIYLNIISANYHQLHLTSQRYLKVIINHEAISLPVPRNCGKERVWKEEEWNIINVFENTHTF